MSAQALRKEDQTAIQFPTKAEMRRAEEGTLIYFADAVRKQTALRDLSALDEMYAYFGSDESAN